jgi:peptidoglycan/xylan/chitin deacetylase (PgdA/CDA1 family)
VRSLWLMYHDVYDREPRPGVPQTAAAYHVSRQTFAAHLQAIGDAGHRVVTAGEFVSDVGASADSVALTFDDGWIGGFEIAGPLLIERGWRATFYVTRDFVDRANFCQRRTLQAAAAAGMEIGVHGVTHRMLSACSRAEVIAEFRDCKDYLESVLGRAVLHASIPGGDRTPTVIACAREAGLASLASSRPGLNHAGASRFDLARVAVKSSTSRADIERYCRFRLGRERTRWMLLQVPRTVLGMKQYSKLRRTVFREHGPNATEVFKP